MQPVTAPSWRYAGLSLVLGAWFLLALASSLGGIYSSVDGVLGLAMPIAILTPVFVFIIAYAASRRVRDLVLGIDTRVLVLLHTWRMVGLGFLMLYSFDLLPAVFAFPAGIGDAAAAIWALVVGVGLYGGLRISRRHLLAWNGFGITDFVVAVSIGSLARYGFLQPLTGDVTTSVMGQFPLVLIPTFIVPLLAITHILVYLQVKNQREVGTQRRELSLPV
jgi:hypothetical protein